MCRNRQDADFLSGCGTFDLKEMKMKKFMFLCVVALGALTVNAEPHRRHHGNNDLRKAADIVNLVGAGVNLVNAVTQPKTVVVHTPPPPPPVVVYHTPPPPPRPVVVHTPPPPPRPVVVHTPPPPPRPVVVRPVPPPPPYHRAPGHFRGAPPHHGHR